MAMASTGPSPDEWEAVKGKIRQLYVDSTLKNVMEKMKTYHGFIASKNQYERKLKEWDLRKNLSMEEREYAIRNLRKRKAEGRASQVIWQGMVLSEKKLKKLDSQVPLIGFGSSPPPQDTVSVSTPPPQMQQVFCPLRRQVRIDNLPFFKFLEIFESQGTFNMASLFLNDTSQNRCHTIMDSSPAEFEILDGYSSDILETSINDYWSPEHHVITLPDQVIFNFFCCHQQIQTLPPLKMDRVNMVLNSVKPQMLERGAGDLRKRVEKLLSPIDQEAFLECLSFFVYFFSNGLHVDEYQDPRRFIEIIEHVVYQPKHALRKILALRDPSILAFMHSILQTAELTDNYGGGRALLEADTDNALYRGRPGYLLCMAVKFEHLDLARKLIQNGADVNAPVGTEMYPQTILSHVKSSECLKMLLRAGARIDEPTTAIQHFGCWKPITPIHGPIIRSDTKLVESFLEAGADVTLLNETIGYASHILRHAIQSDNGVLISLLLDKGVFFRDTIFLPIPRRVRLSFPTILHFAVSARSVDVLEVLLRNKWYSDMLRTGPYAWALLRDAAGNGDADMLKILIDAGADLNATSEKCTSKYTRPVDGVDFGFTSWDKDDLFYGVELLPSTALIAAVESGSVEAVQLLIDHHVDINAQAFGHHGSSALESAQVLGFQEIARVLVQNGAVAPPLQVNENREHELLWAVRRQDLHRGRQLVGCGTDPRSLIANLALRLPRLVYDGVAQDTTHLVSFFLECDGVINYQDPSSGKSLLEITLSSLDFCSAKRLLLQGADPNVAISKNQTSINSIFDYAMDRLRHCCKFRGWDDSLISVGGEVVHLMAEKITLVATTRESIGMAANLKDFDLVQRVVQVRAGNSSTEELYLALVEAVPDRRISEYLISIGASVNMPQRCTRGDTPLQRASSVGDVESIKFLLGLGADINARASPSKSFTTALQAAVFYDRTEAVFILLENGADANAKGSEFAGSGTALMLAARTGYLEITRMLLDYGADVNAEDTLDDTASDALGIAALHGRMDTVQLLLNAGADSYERAIRSALDYNKLVIADLIKDWMEKKSRENSMEDQ